MYETIQGQPRKRTVGYNYHFTDHWYLRVDPAMAGPAWYRGHRIARVHQGDRRVTLIDRDTDQWWNPVNTCDAQWNPGPVITTHTGSHEGITTTWSVTAGGDHPAELWRVVVANPEGVNAGARSRRISICLAVVLPAGTPMGCDTRWDDEARRFVSRSTPFHGAWDDYQVIARDSQATLVAVSPAPQGVCASLSQLSGFLRGEEQDVRWNSVDPPAAAVRWDLELPPGEEHVLYLEITREARGSAPGEQCWLDAVGAAEQYLHEKGGSLTVETPEPRLNEMINVALRKEIMWSARLWRNGVSTPWRNELQDALGYALWNPDEALPFLYEVTAAQEPTGYLKVWNTRFGENPNHPLVNSRHTDGGIWLILCWVLYMRVTGFWDCWNHEIPFADGSRATLVEHLRRAAQFSWDDRGAHGLVLFHDGDWTDPMNGPGRAGKGESGWATEALIVALGELKDAANLCGDAAMEITLARWARELHHALVAALWDGQRFAAGLDDQGRRFGDSDDGRTFLNPQSWGIMAEYAAGADQQRIFRCVAAIASLSTPWGPRLLDPSYRQWDPQVGRVSVKTAGTTENGSVYCHGSAFAAWALALAGDAAASLDILMRTIPGHRDHLLAAPAVPQQLPLYQPNSYFYNPGHPQCGTSTGTLGTGTCTWIVLTVFLQYFGLSFEPAGMRVNPRLPAGWPQASLTVHRRGTVIHVRVVQDDTVPPSTTVNGRAVPEQLIPWPDEKKLTVVVTVSRESQ